MKRVIDGRIYDTDTAMYVCRVLCTATSKNDFSWHDTSLHRSAGGSYFVSGYGGPRSLWARHDDDDGWTSGGSGMLLVTEDDARAYAEEAEIDVDRYTAVFGCCAAG